MMEKGWLFPQSLGRCWLDLHLCFAPTPFSCRCSYFNSFTRPSPVTQIRLDPSLFPPPRSPRVRS
jgi:hypothetical protein